MEEKKDDEQLQEVTLPDPETMKRQELINEVYQQRLHQEMNEAKIVELEEELINLKNELKLNRRRLVKAECDVKDSLKEQNKLKVVADNCAGVMKDFLFNWLKPESQNRVKRMLRYYDEYEQARLMYALLSYLIFGKKTKFIREVQSWHFDLICEKIEEDAIHLPSHTLMVKLMKRYGLFEEINVLRIETIKDDGISESDSSEKEQTSGEGGC